MIWAPNTLVLLLLRTVGFATGAVQAPINSTLVIEESPARYRGLMSGFLQIGYPLGFFLAALIVPYVYPFGWRYIFAIALVGLPYAWLVLTYLREPPAWTQSAARQRESQSKVTTLTLFRPEYRKTTLFLFAGQFLHVFAYGATFLLTAYFREARGWDARDAIQIVGYSYGVGAFGYILAAIVGEFFITRRNTIIIWCWCGSLAFLAMIWLVEDWWPTVIVFSLMTFFFYGTTAVLFTFLAENFSAEMRATGVSFSGSLAVNLGIGLGPLALSYMIDWLGDWRWAFTVCGVVPVFLAGIVFLGVKPVPREFLK
jgi:SHS family lactate transporter-like MFS transporter